MTFAFFVGCAATYSVMSIVQVSPMFAYDDPSVCQTVSPPSVTVMPTQEEAQTAFTAANSAFPDAKLTLGNCAKNSNGLGVICVVQYSLMPKFGRMKPAQVIFDKSNDAWQAILVE